MGVTKAEVAPSVGVMMASHGKAIKSFCSQMQAVSYGEFFAVCPSPVCLPCLSQLEAKANIVTDADFVAHRRWLDFLGQSLLGTMLRLLRMTLLSRQLRG